VEFAFACINLPVELVLRDGRVARGTLFSIDPRTFNIAVKKFQLNE
jgi:small nuclear ribonucleoprotein (snRNP)-like protein